MAFLFTAPCTSLSFTQLRKLREFREDKYAQEAALSLEHSNADPFELSSEVSGYGYLQGTLNAMKFKGQCEG